MKGTGRANPLLCTHMPLNCILSFPWEEMWHIHLWKDVLISQIGKSICSIFFLNQSPFRTSYPLMMATLASDWALIHRPCVIWCIAYSLSNEQGRGHITHSVFHYAALIHRALSSKPVPSCEINGRHVSWCRLILDDRRISNNSARVCL